jgi:hypothetical protein
MVMSLMAGGGVNHDIIALRCAFSETGAVKPLGQALDLEKLLVLNRIPLKDASLGVAIDQQNRKPPQCQSTREVYGYRGLSDSAFLIDQADDHMNSLLKF